jgi:hypothetical protein
MLRCFAELAVKNTTVVSTSGKEYQFNNHDQLNDLNIKLLLLTKQLGQGNFYDFDYDNQIIQHERYAYRCILTNDHESTEVEVIEYYNQRIGLAFY